MMAKRILIVEDDADAAGVVGAYLRRDGFDVAFAEDGKRGVEMHAQWKPDLVLLDVMLPKLSGTDVLSAIRRSSNMTLVVSTKWVEALQAASQTRPFVTIPSQWRYLRAHEDLALRNSRRRWTAIPQSRYSTAP
jgi:DNA-binding response OmpR family regulator